jgi:hypothetical protein
MNAVHHARQSAVRRHIGLILTSTGIELGGLYIESQYRMTSGRGGVEVRRRCLPRLGSGTADVSLWVSAVIDM